MGVAFAVVAGLLVLANMGARTRGASWLSFILKVLCGIAFCLLGVAGLIHVWGGSSRLTELGVFILVGLVLGLLGDASLALKDFVKEGHGGWYEGLFLSGFGFFSLGHVAYIVGLGRGWATPFPWVPILVCAVLAVSYVLSGRALRLNFGSIAWIVAVYSFLVLMLPAMGFFAAATGAQPSAAVLHEGAIQQPGVIAVAGLCFVVSDLVLAWTYFGPGKERGWEHALCYVFYYAAQFGIAASLFWS